MPENSAELLQRAIAGDSDAVEGLIREHEPRLLAFVRSRVGPALRARESVRDLLQEVLLEIVRGLPEFEYKSEPQFRAWLYTVAERRVHDRARYHRRGKRNVERDRGLEDTTVGQELLRKGYSTVSTPLRKLQRKEDVRRLEDAFAALEEGEREVLSLAYFCGMSLAEIGEALGITSEAARKRKTRAQARLASKLGADGHPGNTVP